MSGHAHAQDSVCAVVKIEIKQELTLERQAFDAMMKINNGLDTSSLEDVSIQVHFEDDAGNPVLASSDPNATNAQFFIRVDSLDNINDIEGNGVVAPSTTAEIHWLIIPAPGSAEDAPTGKVYFVGATLTYTMGGEEEVITVEPDRIVVKPLPRLTLDYFLERDVFADDPFTPAIEPPVPFTLGVRVRNNGQATAEDVKIDSAQPEIVENEQGLLIGFEIISSFVSDQPAAPTLLIDFGDIEPNRSKMGRWQMTTTLDGKFTDFTAEFTHADELGGDLTSILEATNAHFLIKDVLVDAPGRDNILDFLADDGDALRVYESGNLDTEVSDQSETVTLAYVSQSGGARQYTLNVAPTAGFMYLKVNDPTDGSMVVKEVIRSDGKRIPAANAWISRTKDNSTFNHYLNLFDVNTPGTYTLVLQPRENVPVAPALQFISDKTVTEGDQVSFLVEASDGNGTIPEVVAAPLPAGAQFYLDNTANNLATYIFDWMPAAGQAGRYEITYTATDGALSSSRSAFIDVLPTNDADNDGMDDDWEMEHFGTLDRDGTGDYDNDGIPDLDEYLEGSDPTDGPSGGPSIPVIESPAFGAEVDTLQPTMTIRNSSIDPPAELTYDFELYADEAMTELVASSIGTAEQLGLTTSWQVQENLEENADYYWRARAYNGVLYSEWVNGVFFVNNFDEPPGPFEISSPADGGEVDSLNPVLEVINSVEPDRDALTYRFEIFADAGLSTPVASVEDISPAEDGTTDWVVDVELVENTLYYWRATAIDEDGMTAETGVASFFVNTFNEAPGAPALNAPADGEKVGAAMVDLVVDNAFDPDNDFLNYTFELDTTSSFDSPALQTSGAIAEGVDVTYWTVSGLIEDQTYFWRARASDSVADSPWVQGRFTVNAVNLPPAVPTVNNPGDMAWVATLTPVLEANPVTDPDGDAVSYVFELYQDEDLAVPVESFSAESPRWELVDPLVDNEWYYWRVRAEDAAGAAGDWSDVSTFFVDDNGINDTPVIELVEPATDRVTTDNTVALRWNDEDPDSSAVIALYYDSDGTGGDGTLIAGDLPEDEDGDADRYTWDTTGLPNGTYYLYAVIDDGNTSSHAYAPGAITLVPEEVIFDNRDTGATAYGEWPGSTAVSGFYGSDYQHHSANGVPPGGQVIDNTDAGFDMLGEWPQSTSVAGYWGEHYQVHEADGVPPGGVVIDNTDAGFRTYGIWASSTVVSGYEGDDYQYHAPNGEPAGEIVIDNTDPGVTVVGEWPTPKQADNHRGDRDRNDSHPWWKDRDRNDKDRNWTRHYDRRDDGDRHRDWRPDRDHDRDDRKRDRRHDDRDNKWRRHDDHDRDNNRRGGHGLWDWLKGGDPDRGRDDDKNRKGGWNWWDRDRHDRGDRHDHDDDGRKHDRGRGKDRRHHFNYQYHPAGSGTDSFTWNVTAESTTQYNVYARWQRHKKPAGDARYTVTHDSGSTTVVVDQRRNGKRWHLLGTFDYTAAMQYSVTLSDQADGYVVADVVKFVPVSIEPNTAIWTFTAPQSKDYDVYVKWTAHENRAGNAEYSLTDDTGTSMVAVDQRQNGGQWHLLGAFAYTEGMQYDVRLTDQADGYVIADAVRFVPADAPPNTARWNFGVDNAGRYEVYGRWTEHANRATDAVYTVADDLGETAMTVNQQQGGGLWNLLGVFDFSAATDYSVSLTDQADGYVIADAMLVIPENAAPNSFTWTIQAPATAQYTVYARWSAHPNRATDATFRVAHDGGENSVTVNQQQNGSQWNELGVFNFTQGLTYPVVLTDQADGYVIADAIRLVPVEQQP